VSALLKVEDLKVAFNTSRGAVRAVDGVSFQINARETVAIVGESGSGKSTTAMALTRLIPHAVGQTSGRVLFQGEDLLPLSDRRVRAIRGTGIGMIFQDPMMALNPVYTIGRQIAEPLILHGRASASQAMDQTVELLRLVGVPAPAYRIKQYPHNLSGGLRQRTMIAMALACRPALLIADEPTTALDVTVQMQVLNLIDELKTALGMAVLLITHDLGVVSEVAQRVIVMYAGRKVEEGPVEEVFRNPRHPYTIGLLDASDWSEDAGEYLREIPGTVPSLHEMPPGCAFAPRCPAAIARCHVEQPPETNIGADRRIACFVAGGGAL
jgi:peptide/nickel transport system ATP-binding protein